MSQETVLITGATSGIGLHLARKFALHQHPLVLVAPDAGELDDVADDLRGKHDVWIDTLAHDLSEEDQIDQVVAEVQESGVTIDILCNNAGRGLRGKFSDIALEDIVGMIRLNIEAVARLTRAFLPPMLENKRGRILNTASVAGFQPGPLMATYHATKAFVLSFSESLATELHESGITVTALCPGPVDTDFFPKAEMVKSRVFQKGNVMSPQEVADAAYKALMAGDRLVVPGATNKMMTFARRFLSEGAQAFLSERMYENVEIGEGHREPGEIAGRASEVS